MMYTIMESTLQKILDCEKACNICFDACLKEDDVKMMAKCIRLDRDCADICALTASFMERQSELTKHILSLCAESCRVCAEECEKHHMDHCHECAKACRECEEACSAAAAEY